MSKKRVFADGMETISLADGMIRMNLYSIIPNPPGVEAPAEHDVDTELVMSPGGFLRAYAAMEQLIKQLSDAGVITKRDGSKPAEPTAPAAPVSPNFK